MAFIKKTYTLWWSLWIRMISWKKRSKSKVRRKFRGSTLISALRLWHEERIRGKTITKHEQMWNLSSDWVCIWVRRNCTLLLRQSIPEQLFCRAASTNYLEQGIDIWINLNFPSHWYDLLQNLRMNWLLFTH